MADPTNKTTLTLIITKEGIESADGQHFELDELIERFKDYEPQYVDFERKGEGPKRKYYAQEADGKNLYQAMLLLAFEIFEKNLDELGEDELQNEAELKKFPVCRFADYAKNEKYYSKGIYKSLNKFNAEKSYVESPTEYRNRKGEIQFVTYSVQKTQPFAPIIFAQKCLDRFGKPGDQFVLTCYEKNEVAITKDADWEESSKQPTKHRNKYRNPFSYKLINSNNMILRGAPGTGKTYLAKEIAADIISKGSTTEYDELQPKQKEQVGFVQFHPNYDYSDFVEGLRPKVNGDGAMSFELKDGIFKKFVKQARDSYKAFKESNEKAKDEEAPKYVFVIDEINRGDISKIFGELFFSIDPGYRGKAGEITTQYSNKLYVPKNVYIIGTMNDIDRSVDSFDFAMRRRFRFVELKANKRTEMLDSLKNKDLKTEAIKRMEALNEKIAETEDLNENYQIGPAYFLKLKDIDGDFDLLWEDYLQPLLQEYIRGFHNEKETMKGFEEAYGYKPSVEAGQGSEESNQESEDK